MPNINVEGPPMDLEKKRQMSKEMTECASRHYGLPMEAFIVVIKENSPENVCVGGRMVCDDRAVRTAEEDKGF